VILQDDEYESGYAKSYGSCRSRVLTVVNRPRSGVSLTGSAYLAGYHQLWRGSLEHDASRASRGEHQAYMDFLLPLQTVYNTSSALTNVPFLSAAQRSLHRFLVLRIPH
jgi:hypothetical protein